MHPYTSRDKVNFGDFQKHRFVCPLGTQLFEVQSLHVRAHSKAILL